MPRHRRSGTSRSGLRLRPTFKNCATKFSGFELLVKKLQAELEAQKQYCSALEAHFKTMQETV